MVIGTLGARLVACKEFNQALGEESPLIEVPGCIQNVANALRKAPAAQALGIPLNRTFPQSHPHLWLP
jgi:hypothetical protein